MITSEIVGLSFSRSLLDIKASINILPKAVFDEAFYAVVKIHKRWEKIFIILNTQ